MKTLNQIMNLRLLALLFATISIISCSDDDDNDGGVDAPDVENEVEVITDVTLIFTPTNGDDPIMVSAQDPDGEGIQELQISDDDEIVLDNETEYILTYTILNALDPDDVEDIRDEIDEEDDEHQLFFSFTEDIFSNPMGDGNIDAALDAVNYNDEDENGLPVGLSTTWTTGEAATGSFTVRLQHQPAVNDVPVKTATSTAQDGDTDFNLTFDLTIE